MFVLGQLLHQKTVKHILHADRTDHALDVDAVVVDRNAEALGPGPRRLEHDAASQGVGHFRHQIGTSGGAAGDNSRVAIGTVDNVDPSCGTRVE